MKLTCQSFFPGCNFEYLDLNQFYLRNKERITDTKTPEQIQWELNALRQGDDVWVETYGGYGENRKDIWKGTYLDEKKNYIHLGIDINAIWGTAIYCPFDAHVINYLNDTDTKIGWGGRIILQQIDSPSPFLILAHIEPNSLITNKTTFKKGDFLGMVGIWPTNGNTFQHLHVQCVKELDINNFDNLGSQQTPIPLG